MNLQVREVSTDDAALIAELTRACWAERVTASSSGHHESAERVLHDLQRGGGFILQLDTRPVGSVRWLPSDTETDVWEILRMGVLPAYRGQGLSQHLMEALIHRAQGADINELRLAVRADQTRVVDLYAVFEFELAPELEYTRANPLDEPPIVMRRWLKR
ncbi:acetyltransferase family protein [Collimonas arenae]|uniref:Acetyltransferase family protein n=1 Tax=Collimonas arenae TaxID=279058 RepID=A0A127PTY5_9BURK|nr:GNAT family N-acetyltransferase [Collimonas arenae]AMP01298.1 acetyltransferase family protein [Collimonas arenae]AMP11196.1 acetyltransferase family protein [Collimonas arenae]